MSTKTFYVDGNSGILAIGNYSTNDVTIKAAITDPLNYLSDLNFHSGIGYLVVKDKISYTLSLTYPAVPRELKTWPEPGSGSSGCGGGGCCFIMLEAKYEKGILDEVIRRYRDEHTTERNKRGYYKLAEVLIPLMQKSKIFKAIIVLTFADPAVHYAKWYYKQNKWGWIFTPLKVFWMTLFNVLGTNKKFVRKNGENI